MGISSLVYPVSTTRQFGVDGDRWLTEVPTFHSLPFVITQSLRSATISDWISSGSMIGSEKIRPQFIERLKDGCLLTIAMIDARFSAVKNEIGTPHCAIRSLDLLSSVFGLWGKFPETTINVFNLWR